MKKLRNSILISLSFVIYTGVQTFVSKVLAQPPGQQRAALPPIPIKGDTTHDLTRHFKLATKTKIAPYTNGFIQRWLVLEPIKKDIARNNIFTDNYLRSEFKSNNFSGVMVEPFASLNFQETCFATKWEIPNSFFFKVTFGFKLLSLELFRNKIEFGNMDIVRIIYFFNFNYFKIFK